MNLETTLDRFCNAIQSQSQGQDFTRESLSPYLNNYLYNHIDSLLETFVSILKILGENNFRYFARQYLLANPPKDPNLDKFGEGFPSFLAKRQELEELDYLSDLGFIDLFWSGVSPEPPIVAEGTLHLWQLILDDASLDDVAIDPEKKERLYKFYKNGDTYLGAEVAPRHLNL